MTLLRLCSCSWISTAKELNWLTCIEQSEHFSAGMSLRIPLKNFTATTAALIREMNGRQGKIGQLIRELALRAICVWLGTRRPHL